ncbi:hypothetical protein IWW50_005202 [Coemansia erecta]|nr:hypothetical protein GGF43_005402 [Coemansia sp. RSA 2618]KAJ2820076.1 hypothetical protein IWW50_005202 [Coemansia erecta]
MSFDSEPSSGTLNLAHSLLRSRVAWLSNAFAPLDDVSANKPRQPLGTAELQIGPHLFADTRFHRIIPDIRAEGGEQCGGGTPQADTTTLALEFSENPNTLFQLPADLGIDRTQNTGSTLHLYFFAQPRRPARERKPSIIKQEWPHYYLADKELTRINISVVGAEQQLTDALAEYVCLRSTKVCHDYRKPLCQPQPTVKYWYAFFPETQRRPALESTSAASVHNIKSPTYRVSTPRVYKVVPVLRPVYRGGGKAGYNAAVAAARLKHCVEVSSDSDSSEGDDMLPVTGNKRSASDSPLARKVRRSVLSPASQDRSAKWKLGNSSI